MRYEELLNKEQLKAVTAKEGPVLVLAGAGSGKTRVLTYRVAYLMDKLKYPPYNILCVTFTNKAAKEMKERLFNSFTMDTSYLNVGTIHARCSMILREDGRFLDINPNYTIYARDDSLSVIKEILNDIKSFLSPAQAISLVSAYKMGYLSYDDGEIGEITNIYDKRLKELNALDFDDLLLKTRKLFWEFPDVLDKYRNMYKYVLVDEFQDVNKVQYDILKMLALGHRNFFAVGDEDQSIYGFRGADVSIIQTFEDDFPEAQIVYLENNYRSNEHILKSASKLIDNNYRKYRKKLVANHNEGEKVIFRQFYSQYDEVFETVNTIMDLRIKGVSYNEIALLFRTNYQTRRFEEKFVREGIPYRLFGGTTFYQRKEILDILAYMRLLVNPYDEISFSRVVQTPKRGIGKITLNKFFEWKRNYNDIIDALMHIEDFTIKGKALKGFEELKELYKNLSLKNKKDISGIAEYIVEFIEYEEYLDSLYDSSNVYNRMQNIEELLRGMKEWNRGDIADYLREISLFTDKDKEDNKESVILATVHNAKGLEFDAVIIPDLVEEIFPHKRTLEEDGEKGIEEERRLLYVAMTRARKYLYIYSFKLKAMANGSFVPAISSRFLAEIEDTKSETKSFKNESALRKPIINKLKDDDIIDDEDEEPFDIGDTVFHKKFGIGKVINIYGSNKHRKVKVSFNDMIKDFKIDTAPLVKEEK